MRQTTAKVAIFSVDPPGLTTFDSFDPDSFTVISAVNDALIYIDNDGSVRPALATSWRRISPVEMEFALRRGVHFHNGELFTADAVVATFEAHQHPTPSAGGKGVLGMIKAAIRVDDYTVRIQTAAPDAMLLRRLFFSSIYPASVLREQGREYLSNKPIGTGPYRFAHYERGREIVLERNPNHWSGSDHVDVLRLPILRQKEWVDRLRRAEIDLALSIDSHDRVRAERTAGLVAVSRPAAISQWFLLANHGPLSKLQVRRALNHGINRRLLVDVACHGYGSTQSSIATETQEGYTPCDPYRYSPELARNLLAEAGFADGFRLRGLVSETSTSAYFTIREFLARIGVELEAEIVPRGEWLRRIVGGHMSGHPYDGDFALAAIDNPILHSLFHHFIFLFSHGPFSLMHDDAYDAQFKRAATTLSHEGDASALHALERYAHDHALVLFTIHEHVHAAFRPGFSCELPASGHFQVASLLTIRAVSPETAAQSLPPPAPARGDAALLLDATSHTGAFYLKSGATFDHPLMQRTWDNIHVSEQRWRLEAEPMVHELVSQAEAKVNLSNVLCSTERVAIIGYSSEGKRLFVNRGYKLMFANQDVSLLERLSSRWEEISNQVIAHGAWVGTVHFPRTGCEHEAPEALYLSVTRAVDDDGLVMGHTFVLTDFSGEEERIRHAAIRTILDNVPYGLFICDAQARIQPGYSDACLRIFPDAQAGVEGRTLMELLAMDVREAESFEVSYEQIFDDFMPEEVSFGNLPERVRVGGRTFSLSGSAVRGSDGDIQAVIFTLLDITMLIDAEREVEELHGTLQVMRYRASFEDFARRLVHELHHLLAGDLDEQFQHDARRELHTAKGVFGQFDLRGLARMVHHIEDQDRIRPDDLREVIRALRATVTSNEALWDIHLDDSDARYTVTASHLRSIEAQLRAAPTAEAGVQLALQLLTAMRTKTAAEFLGPLDENCRQLAARQGKLVRFELEGGAIHCPDEYGEVFAVLPHLIRNSIDHGIELPTERAGKDQTATIRLGIEANDNGLHIHLADDGRGIAADRVAQKALESGLISAEDLAQMDRSARLNLIFADGLSTADDVSETSGRGVGMAAVKATVESLGGQLTLRSEPGRGTEFDIYIRGPERAAGLR